MHCVGKLLGRIVQDFLAKKVLPESQCEFKKGYSCIDIIFMVRQLAEKAIEHNIMYIVLFCIFVKCMILSHEKGQWSVLLKLGCT